MIAFRQHALRADCLQIAEGEKRKNRADGQLAADNLFALCAEENKQSLVILDKPKRHPGDLSSAFPANRTFAKMFGLIGRRQIAEDAGDKRGKRDEPAMPQLVLVMTLREDLKLIQGQADGVNTLFGHPPCPPRNRLCELACAWPRSSRFGG